MVKEAIKSVVFTVLAIDGYEFLLVVAVFMCLSFIAYWRTRHKGWLLSALGFFILFTSAISTLVAVALKVLSPDALINPDLGAIVTLLERCISATIIAVGWGLALKRRRKKAANSNEV